MSHARGHNKFNTHKVEMSIPYRFRTKIPSQNNIWEVSHRNRKDFKKDMRENGRVEIIEANACEDHIHMLVTIPPKMSISKFMGILKGKSSLMIFDRFANLKYKYGNRHFWCRGYYVDTVGRNKTAIAKYIQNQIEEDKLAEQLSMKEYIDPFTGEPTKES